MLVEELMTTNPSCVAPDDHLGAAAGRMWERDCGALPVVDPNGLVVGVVTDRDICMATWSRATMPELILVKDVMSTKLVTCRTSDAIEVAEAAMRRGQVRRLPIIDAEQRLVGMLSLADIAKMATASSEQERTDTSSGVAATLARICQRPLVDAA